MATVKISELSAAGSAISTDEIPVNQGGETKKITQAQIVSAVSVAVDVVSQALSVETTTRAASVQTASAAATSVDARVNTLSDLHSVLSTRFTSASAQFTSADAKTSVLSDRVVSISAQLVSIDTKTSTLSDKVVSISAQLVSIDGRVTSVLSNNLSALSAIVVSGIASVDARVNTVSNQLSAVSCMLAGVVSITGLQAVVNTLSSNINTVSITNVALQTSVTTTSAAVASVDARVTSILSNQISALSALVVSGLASADARITSVLCTDVSAISNRLSIAEFPPNAVNTAVSRVRRVLSVAATVVASATPGAAVTGLSISVKAGGIYRFQSFVMFARGAAGTIHGFGLTFPAMTAARGRMETMVSTVQSAISAGGTNNIFMTQFDGNASNSVLLSVSASQGALLSSYVYCEAVFVPSASGSVVWQMRAAGGTSAISVTVGSFMEVEKIG